MTSTVTLSRLRNICLALPEAEQRETWDSQTFRIRDKIFAMFIAGRQGDTDAFWCKAPKGVQELLVEADPARFFRPPYVGPKGWIGVRLTATTDWSEIEAIIRRSWSMTAPKCLAATLR